jgi:hypothetical protein
MPTLTVALPESIAVQISQDFSQAKVGSRANFIYHPGKDTQTKEPMFVCVIAFQPHHAHQVESLINPYRQRYAFTITPNSAS